MKYVLFVCTQNAGRSQIAQAFFERHGPADVRAESAGDAPAAEIHPAGVEAMPGSGSTSPTAGRRGSRRDAAARRLGDHARPRRPVPVRAHHVEDWDVDDPSGRPLDEVRAIRDEIDARVIDLAQHRIHDIREDRRQHRMRLAQLVPGLVAEFGGRLTDQEIRQIADEILVSYEEVPSARPHAGQPPRARDPQGAQHGSRLM